MINALISIRILKYTIFHPKIPPTMEIVPGVDEDANEGGTLYISER